MRVSRSRLLKASAADVWRAASRLDDLPKWLSGIEAVQHSGGPAEGIGRKQLVSRELYGRESRLTQEAVAWEPERRIALKHLEETVDGAKAGGVRNFHTVIAMRPIADRTEVTLAYEWDSPMGLSWLLSLFLGGRVMGKEQNASLKALEKLVMETRQSEPSPLHP
jgi:uncharacterized protein YndB with AHSA1/START domain